MLCCFIVLTLEVFKHAKTARWHHCYVDHFKMLTANYMLIRLLHTHSITEQICLFFKYHYLYDLKGT